MIRTVAAKLLPYASTWKFLVLQAIAVLLAVYIAANLGDFTMNGQALPIALWFTPPDIWRTVCAIARWFYFIPAFFTVQLVCSELELRLVRNQIIAGLDHRAVVGGWMLQNLFLTLCAGVVSIAAALLFAKQAPGGGWHLEPLLRHESGFLLYGFVFLSITVLFATLLRRPVPTLALLLLWPIAVEPILSYLLNRQGYGALNPYLPFNSLGSLVSFPGDDIGFDPTAPLTFACLGYGALACVLTWLRLRQTQV